MPTDTVYGLVCRADDRSAVERLYALKKRKSKPGTVVASSIDQLVRLGIKKRYLTVVERYWPGAVSVIVPSEPSLKYLDDGKKTLAVRVTDDKMFAAFIEQNGPLLTSSANQPAKKPADSIDQAKKYFTNEVDHYIDGGYLNGRKPSTLIRIVDDVVEVLRQGTVKINEKGEII